MALQIEPDAAFRERHIGPTPDEVEEMLAVVGCETLDELVDSTIPPDIRFQGDLEIPPPVPEPLLLEEMRRRAAENRVFRSYVGMGYHGTITPGVIRRNILENPGWYTQYTPYQAEISQGRLEALLNFQTMVIDLTGLEIANASLLDEGTAAAEAMTLLYGETREDERKRFFVSEGCHPQTIAVLRTRAEPVGIDVVVEDHRDFRFDESVFGALVQYPATDGTVYDFGNFCHRAHEAGAHVAVAADPLALTLLTPPGEFGADVAVGSTQRFGVPMGHGGPHAAYLAVDEKFKRKVPGRIIGVSVDADGNRALRMALQTREQHIRRERATSNICTSQVLLAVMAGMYAVYHGPAGLKEIAERIRDRTTALAEGLRRRGHEVLTETWFDTLRIRPRGGTGADTVLQRARKAAINLRDFGDGTVGVALDETVLPRDLDDLLRVFGGGKGVGDGGERPSGSDGGAAGHDARSLAEDLTSPPLPDGLRRTSDYLQHPVFRTHHSETGMLRYIHRLETRDLSLNTSMIPLGSCTMKLNATTEMEPVTWSAFSGLHPFAPEDQVRGIRSIHRELEGWLAEITGLPAVSLQPNSGAQGEYTGLLVIRAAHRDRGEPHRDVCLIPSSAHGTNPASAVMAGMDVVVVETGDDGTVDLEDLEAKASGHADRLAAIMITYPSTHGVFDPHVREVCRVVHEHGGLVYLDGANLNAQVGLARPGDYGADVCHINLHKTFAIPHGGGGPGMGPICATKELGPYLPGHPVVPGVGGEKAIGPVSAAPWGSSLILTISWAYLALLGREGARRASEIAILNANYMADRLGEEFDILYRGENGRVAHEFILDLRPFRRSVGVTEEDVAKRLMDYGFHAPTMSWPVPGTIMVEPTESESKAELDRYCDALISIRAEIQQVEMGAADEEDNVLKNAPHTAPMLAREEWNHPYGRERAVYPAPWTREHKFWPSVRRVDSAYGDRNLVCACPPVERYRTRGVAGDAPIITGEGPTG